MTMNEYEIRAAIERHHKALAEVVAGAVFSSGRDTLSREDWVGRVFEIFDGASRDRLDMFFIGNGASCSIASHFAMDFTKNTGIRCFSNNDGALLTCYGNDFSFENAYLEMMKRYMRDGDILMAISSSGRSKNIVNAAAYVRATYPHSRIVTFTGFDEENPLRGIGHYNLFLPYPDYGVVESGHSYYIHMLLDLFVERDRFRLQEGR